MDGAALWSWDGEGDLAAGDAGKVLLKVRIDSRSGGEMAHPEEPRVLSSGEKGGKTDFTGILKLCAIQAVRKL